MQKTTVRGRGSADTKHLKSWKLKRGDISVVSRLSTKGDLSLYCDLSKKKCSQGAGEKNLDAPTEKMHTAIRQESKENSASLSCVMSKTITKQNMTNNKWKMSSMYHTSYLI